MTAETLPPLTATAKPPTGHRVLTAHGHIYVDNGVMPPGQKWVLTVLLCVLLLMTGWKAPDIARHFLTVYAGTAA